MKLVKMVRIIVESGYFLVDFKVHMLVIKIFIGISRTQI
jgi:hypothetical protein